MLKIRRPLGRLIFNMGIAIPGKTVFLIETAPWTTFLMFEYFLNPVLICYEWYPINNMRHRFPQQSTVFFHENLVISGAIEDQGKES